MKRAQRAFQTGFALRATHWDTWREARRAFPGARPYLQHAIALVDPECCAHSAFIPYAASSRHITYALPFQSFYSISLLLATLNAPQACNPDTPSKIIHQSFTEHRAHANFALIDQRPISRLLPDQSSSPQRVHHSFNHPPSSSTTSPDDAALSP